MSAGGGVEISAFVGLGSNLDNPLDQVERALENLRTMSDVTVVAVSSFYSSAPFGKVEQPDFINAVAHLRTSLDAGTLLSQLLSIEQAQGRIRGEHWGPRIIDLDLLVHGDTVSNTPQLRLPHPGIAERNFVLLPLQEIAPDLVIPGSGKVADIAINRNEPRISRMD